MNLRTKVSTSQHELHPDRLSTADAKGRRLFVYPADVKGFFRTQRTRVQMVLIAVFLILPWIKINGKQALLMDIGQRQFEFFGLSLRAHNAPLFFLVLSAAGFGLFFVTAIFGRVWCGWGCPQTVFIDGVFRKIERWVEGPALARRQLDLSPMTLQKAAKRFLKWTLFLLATLILTHSFLAYFLGTDHLAAMMQRPPTENWGSFLFMIISSAVILFDFGWFREQFCTIVCPYGRFQSVLMDKSSLIVSYDSARGEPRATPQLKMIAKTHSTKLGDCVNCYRCVQVCPTGIDIRRGVQMECIACTGCIDACDEVMTKLKRPTGLIKYDSLLAKEKKTKHFNLRAYIYLTFCIVSIAALGISLKMMSPVGVEFFRAKEAAYSVQKMEDGSEFVLNHLKIELSNQSGNDRNLLFSILNFEKSEDIQLISAAQPLLVGDGKVFQSDIFVRFPKTLLKNGEKKITIKITDENVSSQVSLNIEKEVSLVGPLF